MVAHYQAVAHLPPTQRKHPIREAERVVRELAPLYIHTSDGDSPEIPDDLIEEIAAAVSDHTERA